MWTLPGATARAELPTENPALPLRLRVVLLDTPEPPTLKSRLASWFPNGTGLEIMASLPPTERIDSDTNVYHFTIWIAFASADQVDVTYGFLEPTTHRFRRVGNRVSLHGGLDELGQERLARIIHSSVMALVEGRSHDVGIALDVAQQPPSSSADPPTHSSVLAREFPALPPAVQPEAPTATDAVRATSGAALRVSSGSVRVAPDRQRPAFGWLGFGYSTTLRGREGLAHGPALMLGLRAMKWNRSNLGVVLDSRFLVPSSFDLEPLRIQTSGARFRLSFNVEARLGQSCTLELSLGGGLDVNHYASSLTKETSVTPSEPRTEAQFFVTPGIRFWAIAPVEFGIGAHLDVLPTNGRYYTAARDATHERFVEPWRAQPGFSLNLRWPGQMQ